MSVGRYARHTGQPATKEVFHSCSMGSDAQALGGHHGYLVDAQGEYAYVEIHTPHDFHKLESIVVVLIARATLTPMNMRVMTNYGRAGDWYYYYGGAAETEDYRFNVELNRIYELPIHRVVDQGPIIAGHYIGIQVSRQAGQNANAIILGAKLKYK